MSNDMKIGDRVIVNSNSIEPRSSLGMIDHLGDDELVGVKFFDESVKYLGTPITNGVWVKRIDVRRSPHESPFVGCSVYDEVKDLKIGDQVIVNSDVIEPHGARGEIVREEHDGFVGVMFREQVKVFILRDPEWREITGHPTEDTPYIWIKRSDVELPSTYALDVSGLFGDAGLVDGGTSTAVDWLVEPTEPLEDKEEVLESAEQALSLLILAALDSEDISSKSGLEWRKALARALASAICEFERASNHCLF